MYIREPPHVLAALRIHEFIIRDGTLSLDAGGSDTYSVARFASDTKNMITINVSLLIE